MTSLASSVIETTIDLKSIDVSGRPIRLRGVRALKGEMTGEIVVLPNDVIRAELSHHASEAGLQPRDLVTLAMLYGKPEPFQEGYVHLLYRMNKMLFYQWKYLENIGFGDAMPRDAFEALPRGPRPKHLKADLRRLAKTGLVDVKWPAGPKKQPAELKLTRRGENVAKRLWASMPEELKEETLNAKRSLFLLDPVKIMRRVHKDYPEWQDIYVEPDEE